MFNDNETLNALFKQIWNKVRDDYGLDLLEVRDLHTGSPIGKIHQYEFHLALRDEGVLDDSEDGSILSIEDLADALLVRSLASARPSPALNRPTTQSLKRLLESEPRIVVAYLLNRYHLSDWRKLNHRTDSWFNDILHRVKVWEHLTGLMIREEPDEIDRLFRELAHWLLELDSKCNLHTLTPPSGLFDAFHAASDANSFEAFVRLLESAAIPLIVEADKRFSIGNRMASSAFVKSWFDNPILVQRKVEVANNKAQRLIDRYGSVKEGLRIEAEREEKRKAKAVDNRLIKGRSSRSRAAKLVNKHAATLDALFRTLGEPDTPPVSTPKIAKPNGLPRMAKG